MKMSKRVKVGLGAVAVFCLVIGMVACNDKMAEIGNEVDKQVLDSRPDKKVDPPTTEEEPVEDDYVADPYESNTGDFEEVKKLIDDTCTSVLPSDGSIEYSSYYNEEDNILLLGFKSNYLDSSLYSGEEIESVLAEYDIVNIYTGLNDQAEELLHSYGINGIDVQSCIFDMNSIPIKYIY
nr:MAG TPA: hypothetical protein [Caudoviricetes sp.]